MFTIEKKIGFLIEVHGEKKLRQCIQCHYSNNIQISNGNIQPFEQCASNGDLQKLLTKVNKTVAVSQYS